ncbi:methionine sulfoxide reductase A [Magnetospirillum sp. LM-5]|uniref:peptide-methionine (S)-S-oxide reductase MsrA n=1 Tax=Magnetospirillum sp. LM-5 TaxID=2681466 RepID=UPI001382166F|nr:peptide-methionine (S)-S-oxide reductase MsrA [Magnetospirillum sp. LM-5]CAA7611990.1 methionine sulfoxide reductase A [Magnetospirillum sp. LM-5]
MGLFGPSKMQMPTRDQALAGRDEVMAVPDRHFVLGSPLVAPFPPGAGLAWFGLGCFWGAEKRFWSQDGVISTAVGYGGGFTPNPTYQEVCSGRTGHNELVQVVFDPTRITYQDLLRLFWESHDPTQGMRQGNDIGTQYRSGIYVGSAQQRELAEASRAAYQARLDAGRRGAITTEIVDAGPFYYAEAYHQQYLAKNPGGYCGLGGTGIAYG